MLRPIFLYPTPGRPRAQASQEAQVHRNFSRQLRDGKQRTSPSLKTAHESALPRHRLARFVITKHFVSFLCRGSWRDNIHFGQLVLYDKSHGMCPKGRQTEAEADLSLDNAWMGHRRAQTSVLSAAAAAGLTLRATKVGESKSVVVLHYVPASMLQTFAK